MHPAGALDVYQQADTRMIRTQIVLSYQPVLTSSPGVVSQTYTPGFFYALTSLLPAGSLLPLAGRSMLAGIPKTVAAWLVSWYYGICRNHVGCHVKLPQTKDRAGA